MALPAPNLDDRSFQAIVDDLKRQIGLRCPEWSDHNVSDPGVTLIELFAYLAEGLQYRMNRIPERNHVRFLDLLGVRLGPPVAARTDLRFSLSRAVENDEQAVTLYAGRTSASTLRTEADDAVEFATDRDLRMVFPNLRHLVAMPQPDAPGAERSGQGARDLARALGEGGEPYAIYSPVPQSGNALYFGFGNDVSSNVVQLDVACVTAAATGLNEAYPAQVWEVLNGATGVWQRIEVVRDATYGFNRNGAVDLALPAVMDESVVAGRRAFWLRARYTTNPIDVPPLGTDGRVPDPYQKPPEITAVSARTVGGTVSASACGIVRNEPLGVSDGKPGQTFRVKYPPTLSLRSEETILVGPLGDRPNDMDGWVPWTRVDDFSGSGPNDRHFTCDELTGEIAFGPALENPEGGVNVYGAVPEKGLVVGISGYRTGGGVRGNVRENTVRTLKSGYPYVAGVTNPRPATGGRNEEELEHAKMRARESLKVRNRAVTAEDFEFLAAKASSSVGRARCVQPLQADRPNGPRAGTVRILVVPALPRSVTVPRPADLRVSPRVAETVKTFLDERRLLTTVVEVAEPDYLFVSIDLRIVADPRVDADGVARRVQERLDEYLHPLYGGPNGDGWPFRRALTLADVYAQVGAVRGVAFLLDARIATSSVVNDDQGLLGPEAPVPIETGVRPAENQLLATRQHRIRMVPMESVGAELP